jgi:hypothetical protein
MYGLTDRRIEIFEKCSILVKVKEGKNFNRRNIGIFRGLKFEPDTEIEQKGAFFKASQSGCILTILKNINKVILFLVRRFTANKLA